MPVPERREQPEPAKLVGEGIAAGGEFRRAQTARPRARRSEAPEPLRTADEARTARPGHSSPFGGACPRRADGDKRRVANKLSAQLARAASDRACRRDADRRRPRLHVDVGIDGRVRFARLPTSRISASLSERFCRWWPSGSPALKPAQSPALQHLLAGIGDEHHLAFDDDRRTRPRASCQWRWLDQAPGGSRQRLTPNWSSPAASPSLMRLPLAAWLVEGRADRACRSTVGAVAQVDLLRHRLRSFSPPSSRSPRSLRRPPRPRTASPPRRRCRDRSR